VCGVLFLEYKVEDENIDIIDDTDWDLCVLIDSCRYDVFKEKYKMLNVKEKVKKAFSRCSCTREFLQKHLGREYVDIIYINHTVSLKYWIPNTKFFKLIEVWKTHWEYKKWGTILPKDMTDITVDMLKAYPEKRVMLHYVQVHPPYLSDEYSDFHKIEFTPENSIEEWETGIRVLGKDGKTEKKKKHIGYNSFFQGVLQNYLGRRRTWDFLNWLGVDIIDGYGRMYQKLGWEGLVKGYYINMDIILKEIKRLLKNYHGSVLISSDHSQNFDGGKKNIYEEPVPWLKFDL